MTEHTTTQTTLTLVGAALFMMLGLNILLLAEIAAAVGASPPAETVITGLMISLALLVLTALTQVITDAREAIRALRRWYHG